MTSPLLHSPPFLTSLHCLRFKSKSQLPFKFRKSTNVKASSQSPSSFEREESRWLREEQRWLREEQRWLREEQRWLSEREKLLVEITALRRRVEALEGDQPSLEAVLVAEVPGIPDGLSGGAGGAKGLLAEETEVKEIVFEEAKVSELGVVVEEKRGEGVRKLRVLKRGSEGYDVRDLQDALQKLGFYSGEEDMEFANFSSGTERAVKTWQASVGSTEDGIMTFELLEKLFTEQASRDATVADGTNGTAVASIKQVTNVQQKVIKETGAEEVKVSEQRVFLLGENRWEEPSRLKGKDKSVQGIRSNIKCLQCRGEGRILCTECDGTGEPNVEPQFLEWVDEGSKCPYCEGHGYTICDVCEGKTIVRT